jgi:hypothetical protein
MKDFISARERLRNPYIAQIVSEVLYIAAFIVFVFLIIFESFK